MELQGSAGRGFPYPSHRHPYLRHGFINENMTRDYPRFEPDYTKLSSKSCRKPKDDFQCEVCNCYFEAKQGNSQEAYDGQVEVNRVALTRLAMNLPQYGQGNMCKVIWKKKQFSWTHELRKNRELMQGSHLKNCLSATIAANNYGADGYTNYHATYVRPRWRNVRYSGLTLAGHRFYHSGNSLSFVGQYGSGGRLLPTTTASYVAK